MLGRPVLVGPLQDGAAVELGDVIAGDAAGLSVDPHQCIQFAGGTSTRDAGIGGRAEVLPAAIFGHCQNAETARGAKAVGRKVEPLAGVGMH